MPGGARADRPPAVADAHERVIPSPSTAAARRPAPVADHLPRPELEMTGRCRSCRHARGSPALNRPANGASAAAGTCTAGRRSRRRRPGITGRWPEELRGRLAGADRKWRRPPAAWCPPASRHPARSSIPPTASRDTFTRAGCLVPGGFTAGPACTGRSSPALPFIAAVPRPAWRPIGVRYRPAQPRVNLQPAPADHSPPCGWRPAPPPIRWPPGAGMRWQAR